jgi:hypothetical protein
MHVEQPVETVLGSLIEGRIDINARIVDEEIDILSLPPVLERFGYRFGKGVKTSGVSNIKLQQRGFPSEFINFREGSFAFVLTFAISDDHVSPVSGELESGIATEAAAATGDESDFIGMFHVRLCVVALKGSFFSEPMGWSLLRDLDLLHTQTS